MEDGRLHGYSLFMNGEGWRTTVPSDLFFMGLSLIEFGAAVKLLRISEEHGIDPDVHEFPKMKQSYGTAEFDQEFNELDKAYLSVITEAPMDWRRLLNDLRFLFKGTHSLDDGYETLYIEPLLHSLWNSGVIEWLHEHECLTNAQYRALQEWHEEWITPTPVQENSTTVPLRKLNKPGYVYILKSEVGHYKIGRTTHPDNRQKTFSVKLPFRVEYELVIKSDDYVTLEEELHTRFDYCRLDGEWFDLTEGDIADLLREFEDHLWGEQ